MKNEHIYGQRGILNNISEQTFFGELLAMTVDVRYNINIAISADRKVDKHYVNTENKKEELS